MKKLIIYISFILFAGSAFAQSNYNYITFGKNFSHSEGDDNNYQIFFLAIPESYKENVTLRLFDPECGGVNDQKVGEWNTETEFKLFGGSDAFNTNYLKDIYGKSTDLMQGKEVFTKTFGIDPYLDNEWSDFATFTPQDGANWKGFKVFKLVVTGQTGDDGNTFNFFLSRYKGKNLSIDGALMFSLNPTIRVDKRKSLPVLRFLPSGKRDITIANFDAAEAPISLTTNLRKGVVLGSSGDGTWEKTKISLYEFEINETAGLVIGRGAENPNDMTFFAQSADGEYLPFVLPVEAEKENNKPEIKYNLVYLADCYSVVFDAVGTIDKDNDQISYTWDFGDGTKEYGEKVVHKYNSKKEYKVSLVAKDNSEAVCNSSLIAFPVYVNNEPVAVFSFKKIVAPNENVLLSAENSKDIDGSIKKYTWQLHDGRLLDGKTVNTSFARAGRFPIELTVVDNSASPCNSNKSTEYIVVNQVPTAKAGTDKWVSVGEDVKFDGSGSKDYDGKIIEYRWELGNGATAEGLTPIYVYSKSGKYRVVLTVRDDANVANSFAKDEIYVNVNYPPVANAGMSKTVAVNEVIYFNGAASKDSDGEIIKYEWNFGDGSSAEGMNVSHAYPKFGKYNVKLKVTDNSKTGSAFASDEITITVNRPPEVSLGEDIVVTESKVQFDGSNAKDYDGRIAKYEWYFGDGEKSSEMSPLHIYKNSGVYTVTLKVWDETKTTNNYAEASKKVSINAKPIADAGMNKIGAPNQELDFSAAGSFDSDGSITSYMWEMGDGVTMQGKQVRHAYSRPGVYTVRLKVGDNTNQERAVNFSEITVTINSQPKAVAGNDIIVAPTQQFVLDGSGSFSPSSEITKYEWEISPSVGLFNGKVIKTQITNPGIYFAILTVTDKSGAINDVSQDTVRIKVNSAPLPNLGEDVYTCENKIHFDASQSSDADGDPLSFSWNFGDGTKPESGVLVTHIYAKGGSYPVVLTVNDGMNLTNSVQSVSIKVKINEPPVANAGSTVIVCSGETVRFDGSQSKDPEGGSLKYSWDFGDGTKGDGINPTKIYKTGGNYQVLLKVEDDSGLPCNSNVCSKLVTVSESPVARAGKDMTVCANSVANFDGTKSTNFDGVVKNYSWDFGDGIMSGGATATHIFAKPGIYRVTLTITGDVKGECDNTDSDQITVTVVPAPKVDFQLVQNYPMNKALTLTAIPEITQGVSITKYSWDFGDGTKAEGASVTKSFTSYGSFIIHVTMETDSKNECSFAVQKKMITINSAPKAEISTLRKVGVKQVVEFSGSKSKDLDGSLKSFGWDFGDGEKGDGMIVHHQYANPGKYIVKLRVQDNTSLENNFSVEEFQITVNTAPVAVASFSASVCPNESVSFDAAKSYDSDGIIKSYLWNFGDGYTGEGKTVNHKFPIEGKYNISLTVDDGEDVINSKTESVSAIKVNSKPELALGKTKVVCSNEKVTITPNKVFDADNQMLKYDWRSSDGFTSSAKVFEHAFKTPGIYKVSLIVDDNELTSCSKTEDTLSVIVNSMPVAKTTHVSSGFTGGANDDILFDGSSSSDADGDQLTYSWDFGDGKKANGIKVYHLFEKPGKYKIKLTVSDGKATICSNSTDEFFITISAH